jgi:hypothetical protein
MIVFHRRHQAAFGQGKAQLMGSQLANLQLWRPQSHRRILPLTYFKRPRHLTCAKIYLTVCRAVKVWIICSGPVKRV